MPKTTTCTACDGSGETQTNEGPPGFFSKLKTVKCDLCDGTGVLEVPAPPWGRKTTPPSNFLD